MVTSRNEITVWLAGQITLGHAEWGGPYWPAAARPADVSSAAVAQELMCKARNGLWQACAVPRLRLLTIQQTSHLFAMHSTSSLWTCEGQQTCKGQQIHAQCRSLSYHIFCYAQEGVCGASGPQRTPPHTIPLLPCLRPRRVQQI